MEYKLHFNFLLKYDNWANNNVLIAIKENNLISGKPIELFSHINNAEIIWLGRIKKISSFVCDPFVLRSLEECIDLIKKNYFDWKDYIESLEDKNFNNLIEYKNLKGEDCISKIWEIISHTINHSTYHRAQIASSIRSMNITPPVTDLIGFARLNKD